MHIETLKTFCDLVDSGSFSRAAQLNFVSQSAVSQQLKALESRYARPLVERSGRRGVHPTEAGALFYAGCRDVIERFCALEERVRQPSAVIAGTIRMATVYSIGLHALPRHVTRFMKAHPRVKVHLEYSRTDKICDACLSNAIDFGIVALPLRRANVAVVPWHDEKLVLICPPQHRLARRRTVKLAQLQGESFIAFERDIPTRRTVDRLLKAHRVAVNTSMEFDNIETIKRSVEVGSGVSIVPETTVRSEVKSGLLSKLDFAEGPFTRSVGVIHRKGRVLSTAAREFVELLVASS